MRASPHRRRADGWRWRPAHGLAPANRHTTTGCSGAGMCGTNSCACLATEQPNSVTTLSSEDLIFVELVLPETHDVWPSQPFLREVDVEQWLQGLAVPAVRFEELLVVFALFVPVG